MLFWQNPYMAKHALSLAEIALNLVTNLFGFCWIILVKEQNSFFPLLACILSCHRSVATQALKYGLCEPRKEFSKAFKYVAEVSGITWGAKLVKVNTLRSCRFQGHPPTSTEISRNPFTDCSGIRFKFIFTLTCKRHEIQALVKIQPFLLKPVSSVGLCLHCVGIH